MADFCKQCSVEIFGKDFKELAGITTPAHWADGKAVVVICEGCGPIQVDPDGNCISQDCIGDHRKHTITKDNQDV